MTNYLSHLTSHFSRFTCNVSRLTSHPGFIRYLKNTSWLMAEKVLRMVVSLFVGVWVARYLGPERFGLLSYAQSFVALFTAIATLGLDGIVVREIVKDESKKDELISTAFWLKVAGAIAMIGVIAIAVNLTSSDIYTKILIFIIALGTIFQAFNVIDFYFQAKVLGKYIALANSTTLMFSSLIKVLLILTHSPLIYFAIAYAFDSLILALGYLYFYFYYTSHTSRLTSYVSLFTCLNTSTAKQLLKDSWPLILSGLVVMIYMRVDQVMIKEMLGDRAVGLYSAAVRISEAWYFVPMVVTQSLFPAIINAKKQSEELYYARLQSLYDLMVWMAIAVALPVTFFSNWIIKILYGQAYLEAANVLMIHIWAGVFVGLGVASGKWFISENLQSLAFLRTFYGAVVNIILNYLLIPELGPKGAAIATLIAQSFAAYFFDMFAFATRKVFWMKTKAILMIQCLKKL